MKRNMINSEVELVEVAPRVFCFPHMASEPGVVRLAPLFSAAIEGRDPGLLTDWVVGSGVSDWQGNPRTSKSHTSGDAIDVTPIWNNQDILDPAGAVYELAWNLMSLNALRTINKGSLSIVVEGDHLHLTDKGNPSYVPDGAILAVPTMSTWYDKSSRIHNSPAASALFGRAFLAQPASDGQCVSIQTIINPNEIVMKYLGVDSQH